MVMTSPRSTFPTASCSICRRGSPRLFLRWLDACPEGGFTYPRLRVLEALHCQGPAKMKSLADALGLSARNMTAVADSLESEGLLRRVAHPTDRRATLLGADRRWPGRGRQVTGAATRRDQPPVRRAAAGNPNQPSWHAGDLGSRRWSRAAATRSSPDRRAHCSRRRSAVGARPLGAQRRPVERRCVADHLGARPARRRARLHAVLGGRTPQHAQRRVHLAGCADRPPRRAHVEHPGRLRRRDAAQPRAARHRRAVRHAREPASRAHRPRHRAGARHRSAHRSRAAALDQPETRGRLPSRLPRPDGPARRSAHRDGLWNQFRATPAATTSRRSSCSDPVATAPSSPAISGCRSPSPTTSTPAARCRPPSCTTTRSSRRSCSTSPT